MTHVRTIAAVITAVVAAVVVPQIATVTTAAVASSETVEARVAAPITALPEVEIDDTEIIEGVRIVSDDEDRIAAVTRIVERFESLGWPITNTEVRYSEDECDGAVGFHTEERGHHVVVLCTDTEWTLIHELGHVWSDLYMSEAQRDEFVGRRGLDSWHEGDYDDRGTEQAAQLIAFGLYDTAHIPSQMGERGDYASMVEDVEWLMGVEPVHRQRTLKVDTSHESTTRIEVAAATVVIPADVEPAAVVEHSHDDHDHGYEHDTHVEVSAEDAPAEYRFPVACGYPRWHSRNGGYGYVDPRDWTHVGVDIYAFEGTPVVSPVHGTVIVAGWGDIPGWKVVVEDRFGHGHVMVHLSKPPVVSAGSEVTAGQQIGMVGRSGNASGGGPHLHYEIRTAEGGHINPMVWLNRTDGTHVEAAPHSFSSLSAPAWSSCELKA